MAVACAQCQRESRGQFVWILHALAEPADSCADQASLFELRRTLPQSPLAPMYQDSGMSWKGKRKMAGSLKGATHPGERDVTWRFRTLLVTDCTEACTHNARRQARSNFKSRPREWTVTTTATIPKEALLRSQTKAASTMQEGMSTPSKASQRKKKNDSNPVPRAFGEIKLPNASTALLPWKARIPWHHR